MNVTPHTRLVPCIQDWIIFLLTLKIHKNRNKKKRFNRQLAIQNILKTVYVWIPKAVIFFKVTIRVRIIWSVLKFTDFPGYHQHILFCFCFIRQYFSEAQPAFVKSIETLHSWKTHGMAWKSTSNTLNEYFKLKGETIILYPWD